MPRYRTPSGVVIDIPVEKAERIGGKGRLWSVDSPPPVTPPSPRKRRSRKTTPKVVTPDASTDDQ